MMEAEAELMPNSNISDAEEDDANENKGNDIKVFRPLRVRYWDSQEEFYLIRMWRQYADEITTMQWNEPVHLKISYGMRERGVNVNSQECRRRINSLLNKYKREVRKMQETGRESTWRLFALIDSVLKGEKARTEQRPASTVRSSELFQDEFTLVGIESLRRENRLIAIQRDMMVRDYNIRKAKAEHEMNAFQAWGTLSDVIIKQVIEQLKDDA